MVVVQHAHDVRASKDRSELEGDLVGIGSVGELAQVSGRSRLVREQVAPLLLDRCHRVVNASRTPSDLGARRDEEASAWEDATLDVRQEAVAQRQQAFL